MAERFSNAPSYQQLLAASAIAADAAAQAALEAHAAAEAALAGWQTRCEEPGHTPVTTDIFADPFFTQGVPPPEPRAEEQPAPALTGTALEPKAGPPTVAHHAPLPARSAVPRGAPAYRQGEPVERTRTFGALVDAFAEAVVPAAHSLPAKLIEFPRELIAPRKQRPRLAEGPLFEQQSPQESSGTPLRIFEVETEGDAGDPGSMGLRGDQSEDAEDAYDSHGATVKPSEPKNDLPRRRGSFHVGPEASARPAQPARQPSAERQQSGWSSIRLGEHPQPQAPGEPAQPAARRPEQGYQAETAPALHELAPLSDRSMAALVDGGIVAACFLLSLFVFAACTVHPPAGKAALAVGLIVFGALATFYGWLFMSFGGGSTPGMRYARIALCSFADENPTRKELQNRVPATALALLPLGLGVFWALLDEDQLGWHDRMTGTYQRSYR